MKKYLPSVLVTPLLASMPFLAGCGTTPVPVQSIAQLHTVVVQQCSIIVPFLDNMNAMSSQLPPDGVTYLNQAIQGVDPVCNAVLANPNAVITVQQIQKLVSEGVPMLIKTVNSSSLKDEDKTAIDLAVIAAESAISFELGNVVSTSSAPAPAPASPASASSAQ